MMPLLLCSRKLKRLFGLLLVNTSCGSCGCPQDQSSCKVWFLTSCHCAQCMMPTSSRTLDTYHAQSARGWACVSVMHTCSGASANAVRKVIDM